jgi:hypothetical protein
MTIEEMFNGSECSFTRKKNERITNSCFTNDDLTDLFTSIGLPEFSQAKYDEKLKFLRSRNPGKKESQYQELTFTDHPVIKQIVENSFLPEGPPGDEWLSDLDIDSVFKHVEKLYSNFEYGGTHPSDKLLKNKYRIPEKQKVAWVFNTSPEKSPGQHWIAVFLDKDKKTIEFFDPSGNSYLNNKYLTSTISKIANEVGGHVIKTNRIKHQVENGQCGVYSVFYILMRLMQVASLEEFNSKRVSDKAMRNFRSDLFRLVHF